MPNVPGERQACKPSFETCPRFCTGALRWKDHRRSGILRLDLLEVDSCGLDQTDRRILYTMTEKFMGRPVGLDTLAAAIGEDAGTIEEVYEPFLIKNGLSCVHRGKSGHRSYVSAPWN